MAADRWIYSVAKRNPMHYWASVTRLNLMLFKSDQKYISHSLKVQLKNQRHSLKFDEGKYAALRRLRRQTLW